MAKAFNKILEKAAEYLDEPVEDLELAEDAVFFDILAEELARRDLGCLDSEPADYTELNARMDEYMDEFEKSGVENLVIEA